MEENSREQQGLFHTIYFVPKSGVSGYKNAYQLSISGYEFGKLQNRELLNFASKKHFLHIKFYQK